MSRSFPDSRGKFGPYGGRFVPDTLMAACSELEKAYAAARRDRSFWKEFRRYNATFAGRPIIPSHNARCKSRGPG